MTEDEQIAAIYEKYPRHVGRRSALRAIEKAVKRIANGAFIADTHDARRFLYKKVAEYALSPAGLARTVLGHEDDRTRLAYDGLLDDCLGCSNANLIQRASPSRVCSVGAFAEVEFDGLGERRLSAVIFSLENGHGLIKLDSLVFVDSEVLERNIRDLHGDYSLSLRVAAQVELLYFPLLPVFIYAFQVSPCN